MFGLFKSKEKGNILHSPCNGKVVPITEVPDPTFAEKILGDGFAVIPAEGKVYAPADLWYPDGYRIHPGTSSDGW